MTEAFLDFFQNFKTPFKNLELQLKGDFSEFLEELLFEI